MIQSQLEVMMRRVITADIKQKKEVKGATLEDRTDHLLALVKYLKYYPEVENDLLEKEMAIHMLEMHRMAHILMIKREEAFDRTMKSYQKTRGGYCVRCGRPIMPKVKTYNGMGQTCYQRAENGVWAPKEEKSPADIRLEYLKENLTKSRFEKEGVRKLADKFEVGISTIRFDINRAEIDALVDERYENLRKRTETLLTKYKPTKIPLLIPPEREKAQ